VNGPPDRESAETRRASCEDGGRSGTTNRAPPPSTRWKPGRPSSGQAIPPGTREPGRSLGTSLPPIDERHQHDGQLTRILHGDYRGGHRRNLARRGLASPIPQRTESQPKAGVRLSIGPRFASL